MRQHYLPRSVLILNDPGDKQIEKLVPYVKVQGMRDKQPTAYVCENYVCKLPTHDADTLEAQLTAVDEQPAASRTPAR